MFGGFGLARSTTSALFTSKLAIENGIKEKYSIQRQVLPVHNVRNLGKQHMIRNSTLGEIKIDPETYKVTFNGKIATCEPAKELPLTQLYHLV
jgi:urease subunit alpha